MQIGILTARTIVLGLFGTSLACCVTLSQSLIFFTYKQGSALPAPINVGAQNAVQGFTVSVATNPAGWLAVTPTQGPSTAVLSISADPRTLATGEYLGIITVTENGPTSSFHSASLQVQLTVAAGAGGTTGPQPTSSSGRIAHIADGGGWKTIITAVNLLGVPQTVTVRFWSDNGKELPLPIVGLGLSPGGASDLLAFGSNSFETAGSSSVVSTGWATVEGSMGNTNGFSASAVFRSRIVGRQDSEAVSPMMVDAPRGFVLPFNNLDGFSTGVSVVNVGSLQTALPITIRDAFGAVLFNDAISLGPGAHLSFSLADKYPSLAGRLGTVEIGSGQVAVLGLRFNPSGSFTSIPPIPRP
jgi:hypothetical protein